MPKHEAPVIDQIRVHRKFLQKGEEALEAGIDYPRTRKVSEIISAMEPPTLAEAARKGTLRKKAKSRYSE